MKLKITRRDILKAIRTEPLRNGDFVFIDAEKNKDGKCMVCAVGAVLRQVGLKDEQIDDKAYDLVRDPTSDFNGIKDMLKEKDYLSALSSKYELLADQYGNGKKTKEKLIAFVKKNFPLSFVVRD